MDNSIYADNANGRVYADVSSSEVESIVNVLIDSLVPSCCGWFLVSCPVLEINQSLSIIISRRELKKPNGK